MRIVAIGLGGGGCRIVDSLYATDRKSSSVTCVQGLAIDVDEQTLRQLEGLPEKAKMYFPATDLEVREKHGDDSRTASIDIKEIISRVQNFESAETDAFVICCGLGGSMVDVAPHIIAGLRSSTVEPIFGLITLPCLAEGEKRSAKAADDIDVISPLLDGIILFDNETWYKKIMAKKARIVKKDEGLAKRLGLGKSEQEISPERETYLLLNEAIVRRISLILRAGEFKADGGIDLAEVVLDSGEVLNTMKGMGFITIGYAVERLPHNPLSFLSRLRPKGIFAEENTKKASRIVELAKQAIYHEISTPCDMTSAHKALILVAGPSHELSMKGYMTVRKWIDRSIAGLETRSGDYPVMNTKNVAIIIMLSGLENIPRIGEIRDIRGQYHTRLRGDKAESLQQSSETSPAGIRKEEKEMKGVPYAGRGLRDEMLVLPVKKQKGVGSSSPYSSEGMTHSAADGMSPHRYKSQHPSPDPNPDLSKQIVSSDSVLPAMPEKTQTIFPEQEFSEASRVPRHRETPDIAGPQQTRHRVIVTTEDLGKKPGRLSAGVSRSFDIHDSSKSKEKHPVSGAQASAGSSIGHSGHGITGRKDEERLKIERELQRQRMVAISGHKPQGSPGSLPDRSFTAGKTEPKRELISESPQQKEQEVPDTRQASPERTVIISKRKRGHVSKGAQTPLNERGMDYTRGEGRDAGGGPHSAHADAGDRDGGLKAPAHHANDGVFEGMGILKKTTPPARDSSLIHTTLKPKKNTGGSRDDRMEAIANEQDQESSLTHKKPERKRQKHDDISWI